MKEIALTDELRIRDAADVDSEKVRTILEEVLREYGLRPDFDDIDKDLFDVASFYNQKEGRFFVIVDESNEVLGTAGLLPVSEEEIELRKMYFLSAIRGKGLGKQLLSFLIGEARSMGYKKMVLETASPLKEAIGLYRSFGFEEFDGIHADRCDKAFSLRL